MNSLTQVEEKLEKLKLIVYETINSNYNEYVNAYKYYFDLQEEVDAIKEEIDLLTEQTLITAQGNLDKQLTECRNLAFALYLLAKLHSHLQNLENLLDMREFLRAASLVKEISSMLEQLQMLRGHGWDISIYKLIKDCYLKQRSCLLHRLEELFSTVAVFNITASATELTIAFHPTLTFSRRYSDNPITINDLFSSLETMEMLVPKLSVLAENLTNHLILPLIRNPQQELVITRSRLNATLRNATKASATSTSSIANSTSQNSSSLAFDKILEVCRFIKSTIFETSSSDEASRITMFARIWWPDLWKHIRCGCLIPNIPEDYSQSQNQGYFVGKVLEFEHTLRGLGLMPSDEYLISHFVHDIEIELAKKKRTDLLVMVRDIILSEDRNTVEVSNNSERGGLTHDHESKHSHILKSQSSADKGRKEGFEDIDSSFRLPTCHISVQTQTLVELAYQTLNDATKSEETGATTLYYLVRDIFDMFRNLSPVYNVETLENNPTRAAIFHNDCLYICHHLVTMGYQFRDRLPPPLDHAATFIDMVPPFRKLGEEFFRFQMRRQRDLICETIQNMEGFNDIGDDSRSEVVEKAIKQALYQLGQLDKSWKSILPTHIYLQSIGILTDTLLEVVMKQVFALTSISPVETHQLRYLLGLLNKVESWYEVKSGFGKRKLIDRVPVQKYAKLWSKYLTIMLCLEVTLPELASLYDSGKLQELKNTDCKMLVSALFPESIEKSALLQLFDKN